MDNDENLHSSAVQKFDQNLCGLDDLAQRIRARDQLAEEHAHAQWLENGRDLLKAKNLMGHGNFGDWCKRELNYTVRTAQKLMSAAELCGPYLKNESRSHLLKPTLVYVLSAPSVSQEIRESYVPRLIAGEDVGAELRIAIKDHRDAVKKAKERETSLAAKSPEARKAQVKREEAKARRETREAEQRQTAQEQRQIELERQASARSAALELILERIGDDLPVLMSLTAEAGSGNVFEFHAESEWQALVQGRTTLVEEETVTVTNESKVVDVEVIDPSVVSEDEPPRSPMPMTTTDEAEAVETVHDKAALAEWLPKPSVTAQVEGGKSGGFPTTKSAFPPRPLKLRAEHMQSHNQVQPSPKPGGLLGRPV